MGEDKKPQKKIGQEFGEMRQTVDLDALNAYIKGERVKAGQRKGVECKNSPTNLSAHCFWFPQPMSPPYLRLYR